MYKLSGYWKYYIILEKTMYLFENNSNISNSEKKETNFSQIFVVDLLYIFLKPGWSFIIIELVWNVNASIDTQF